MAIPNQTLNEAITSFQSVLGENERLKAEIEQNKKLMDSLKEEIDTIKEQTNKLKPYIDIIEQEDKEGYLLKITDTRIFKLLKLRARQVYGESGDKGYLFKEFIEIVLDYSLNIGWVVLRQHKFPKRDVGD